MLSRRVPHSVEPNAWTRLLAEQRARRAPLLDLTESNPTRTGLVAADAGALEALADPAALDTSRIPEACSRRAGGRPLLRGARLADLRRGLILTSGTSESYAHLFRLLCDPGRRS